MLSDRPEVWHLYFKAQEFRRWDHFADTSRLVEITPLSPLATPPVKMGTHKLILLPKQNPVHFQAGHVYRPWCDERCNVHADVKALWKLSVSPFLHTKISELSPSAKNLQGIEKNPVLWERWVLCITQYPQLVYSVYRSYKRLIWKTLHWFVFAMSIQENQSIRSLLTLFPFGALKKHVAMVGDSFKVNLRSSCILLHLKL